MLRYEPQGVSSVDNITDLICPPSNLTKSKKGLTHLCKPYIYTSGAAMVLTVPHWKPCCSNSGLCYALANVNSMETAISDTVFCQKTCI